MIVLLLSMIGAAATTLSATHGLSKSDFATLPIDQLSTRALGEAGKLMIGVDRSNLPYSIKFFGRAYAPPTQYGLCASDWVTLNLDFSPVDTYHIDSISTQSRFGIVGSIYRYPDKEAEEHNRHLCASLSDVELFFPAPDWIAAKRVLYYVDYIQGNGIFRGKNYSFECTGSCKNIDGQSYLTKIALKNVTNIKEIDCPSKYKADSCYKISLTGSPPGVFPRELRVYGRGWGEKTEVIHASLWIGTTLF